MSAGYRLQRERALAMAYELSRLLWELGDANSTVAEAWERTEDVIGMLEPDDGALPRLRLVVVDRKEMRA